MKDKNYIYEKELEEIKKVEFYKGWDAGEEVGRKEMKDEIIELILSIFDGKIHKSPTEKTDLIKLIKEPK